MGPQDDPQGNISIQPDTLVPDTGCAAVPQSKAGFKIPEAAALAGPGLQAVCKALGVQGSAAVTTCYSTALRPISAPSLRCSRTRSRRPNSSSATSKASAGPWGWTPADMEKSLTKTS